MPNANEDQSKAFDDYMTRLAQPSPAAEPFRVDPKIADEPNGWDQGVVPDGTVPVHFRGNICSGINKPKSLKRYPDD